MGGPQTSMWDHVPWSHSSMWRANVPTLGPRFLVKFLRMGKANSPDVPPFPLGHNIDRCIRPRTCPPSPHNTYMYTWFMLYGSCNDCRNRVTFDVLGEVSPSCSKEWFFTGAWAQAHGKHKSFFLDIYVCNWSSSHQACAYITDENQLLVT